MLKKGLLLFILSSVCWAAPTQMMFHSQQLPLKEALTALGQVLHMNLVLSPNIQGIMSVNIHTKKPKQLLETILLSHHLATWKIGDITYIAPEEELLKQKQQRNKWVELKDLTLPITSAYIPIHYAKASDVAQILQATQLSLVTKKGRLSVDARSNAILLTDTNDNLAKLRSIIAELDQPVKQILIEARLINIDHDAEKMLGVSFTTAIKSERKSDSNGVYHLTIAKLADGARLDVKLAALEKQGKVELLSRPSLFTSNLEPAYIEAGEEVPYQEASETGATAIVFKKAVLGLRVTPQLLPGNNVLLALHINQDRPTNRLVLGMPTIATRQIKTQVRLKDGQTIVLGGIFERNDEKSRQQIPFLGSLPLIGFLFRTEEVRLNRRELLIFITPKLTI